MRLALDFAAPSIICRATSAQQTRSASVAGALVLSKQGFCVLEDLAVVSSIIQRIATTETPGVRRGND